MRQLLLVLAFMGCVASLPPLDSGALQTPSGHNMHWEPHRFPLPVMVNDGMPLRHQHVVYTAMERWEELTQRDLFNPRNANGSFLMFSGIPVLGYVTAQTGELGKNSRGEIRGLAELNMQAGDAGRRGRIHSVIVTIDDDVHRDDEAFQVALHEFGHALSLRHDANDRLSIMWYSTGTGNQYVQPEDILRIQRMVDGESP